MRKSVSLFLLLLLIVSSFSFVLAEDNNAGDSNSSVDEATRTEVNVMGNTYGAKMRMLQLQYEIEKRILRMEAVVDYLEEKGENVDELRGIIEEMRLLADEASEVSGEDFDAAVEKFLAIKQDAKDLVAEFRNFVSEMLNDEDRAELRRRFGQITNDDLDRLREEIREKRREMNAERVREALENANVQDDELVDSVRNGDLSDGDVRARLRVYYSNAAEEARMRVKETAEQRRAAAEERIRSYVQNREAIVAERVQTRASNLMRNVNDYAEARAARLRNAE